LGNALTVDNKGRTKERRKIPKNNGKSQRKSKKGRSKSRGKMDCWHYGKPRHLKKDCWSQKRKQGDGQHDDSKEANVASNKL
jgi:hypothetical protein